MTKAESLSFSAVEIRHKNMPKNGYFQIPTTKVLNSIIPCKSPQSFALFLIIPCLYLPSKYRYRHEEFMDMGTLSGDNISRGDYYCSKKVKGTDGDSVLTGYVLPKDALELLPENHCIGIVYRVGQNEKDEPTDGYPKKIYEGTDTEDARKCHGYVIALTNASPKPISWCSSTYKETPMGTSTHNDWNGYQNCQTVIESTSYQNNPADFPAINVCHEYGNSTFKPLEAPYNSSGWYLPSEAQGVAAIGAYKYLEASFNHVKAINKISEFQYISSDNIGLGIEGNTYWSSTEGYTVDNICNTVNIFQGSGGYGTILKISVGAARPILSF